MARKLFVYGERFYEEEWPGGPASVDCTDFAISVGEGTLAEFFKGLPGKKKILAEISRIFEGIPRLDVLRARVTSSELWEYDLNEDDARLLCIDIVKILESFGVKADFHRKSEDTWELTVEA